MSSGDDSATDEWERELMFRGTQSRRRQIGQQSRAEKTTAITATVAKIHVNEDIEKAEASIESTRRSMASTRLDIAKSEKKIGALRKQIEKLESSEPFFRELATVTESSVALNLLSRYKSVITRLPRDQKEMIDLLDRKLKGTHQPMDVDSQ